MTRRSKRELERALDRLEDGGTVREWVREQFRAGSTVDLDDSPGEDAVLAMANRSYEIYVDAAIVPNWIDVDVDLPVSA